MFPPVLDDAANNVGVLVRVRGRVRETFEGPLLTKKYISASNNSNESGIN